MGTPGAPQLTGLAPLWIPRGRATGQPLSCLWGRLRCSQGSWLRLAGRGPKTITHSGGPLLLCPFSLLPAIPGVPEDQKQPLTCQLQGQAETDSQEDLGRAPGTKHVSFREEEREAEKSPSCGCGAEVAQSQRIFQQRFQTFLKGSVQPVAGIARHSIPASTSGM